PGTTSRLFPIAHELLARYSLVVMKLDRIETSGFKSLREADIELRSLNVLIGANGAGKSNLIGVFGLLQAITLQHLQVTIRRGGGASSFLHFGPKRTRQIRIRLHFGKNGYEAVLEHGEGDALFFHEESCWFQGDGHPKPYDVPLGK